MTTTSCSRNSLAIGSPPGESTRLPAAHKDYAWLKANQPSVMWQGKRYRCVGASRLGDVWLKGDGPLNAFYDHRVDIAELYEWQRPVREENITAAEKDSADG